MHDRDKGGKWLIRHYGGTILRLAGTPGLISWKAVQAEPVQPRRLPDGLIEARLRGRSDPSLFALEISTYPYPRLVRQAADDALLIYLERGLVPEVIVLVLRPRGKRPVPRELDLPSDSGITRIHVQWKVIELWNLPADELLASGDVGLIPLVPLSRFDGPVEPILDECRKRIERDVPEGLRENMRVVTHFMAGLKYNDPRLFLKLGGKKAMIKTGSPLLRELFEEMAREAREKDRQEGRLEGRQEGRLEGERDAVVTVLTSRFGDDAARLSDRLKSLDEAQLRRLLAMAATCPDLASFGEHLPTRRRRRKS